MYTMVDIPSASVEIRRGIKKRRRKKPQDKNIMSASATQGSHKTVEPICVFRLTVDDTVSRQLKLCDNCKHIGTICV